MTINITTGDNEVFSTSKKSFRKKFKKNGDSLRYIINFIKSEAKTRGTAKRPSGLKGSVFVIFHKTDEGIEKIDFDISISDEQLEGIIQRVWSKNSSSTST